MIAALDRGIKKIRELLKQIGILNVHRDVGHDPIGDFIFGTGGGAKMHSPVPSGGQGVYIQGISERELIDMVDRGLFFRLRRAPPTPTRV
jgi:hypothetical protein